MLGRYLTDPVQAQAVAVTAMAAIEIGLSLWSTDQISDLGDALDQGFDLTEEAFSIAVDCATIQSRM